MKRSKQEYEEAIRSSILFSLDKEKDIVAYKREALKMVEMLYCYMLTINTKYAEFGLEITETANACIKNYNSDAGDFLNYFNRAMSLSYNKARSKKRFAEMHAGAHISESERRIIGRYIHFAEQKGNYDLSEEDLQLIAESSGLDILELREYISAYNNSFLEDTIAYNNDGEEIDILDLIPVDGSIETEIESESAALDLLKHIDALIKSKRPSHRDLLSKLFTRYTILALSDNQAVFSEARKLSFFDNSMVDLFVTGNLPNAKEIGAALGMSEANVSMICKRFKSQL